MCISILSVLALNVCTAILEWIICDLYSRMVARACVHIYIYVYIHIAYAQICLHQYVYTYNGTCTVVRIFTLISIYSCLYVALSSHICDTAYLYPCSVFRD